MKPFGHIITTVLVGETSSNNPFFDDPLVDPNPVVGDNETEEDTDGDGLDERSRFYTHAFVILDDKVYDAMVGSHLGAETKSEYIDNAVDKSTPAEAAEDIAGDADDVLGTATIRLR